MPITGAEDIHPVLRRTIAEVEITWCRVNVQGGPFEQLFEVFLDTPSRRRRQRRRRWHVLTDDLEQLTDEPARRPIGQPDAAPGPAYAHHLARGACMVG